MFTQGIQIDWSAVRQKLQASQQALERTMSIDPERLEALFAERARKLMERHRGKVAGVATTTVLAFAEGSEKFAIDIAQIVEVLPLPPVTPLPGALPEVLGLVNLRGEFLTVVGIGRLLGIERERDAAAGSYLLVLRGDNRRLGLRVDAVDRIQPLRLDNLTPPPRGEDRPAAAETVPIKGVSPDEALIVIDGPAIVASFTDKGKS